MYTDGGVLTRAVEVDDFHAVELEVVVWSLVEDDGDVVRVEFSELGTGGLVRFTLLRHVERGVIHVPHAL